MRDGANPRGGLGVKTQPLANLVAAGAKRAAVTRSDEGGRETILRRCIPAGCQKVDPEKCCCRAVSDPERWWLSGSCPALTVNPRWEDEVDRVTAVYAAKIRRQQHKRRTRSV